ncbi:Trans-1,2-dihydrobenzene-1,2-diol dehydrogenase-like isoform X2 [Aphelenchoides fujianensis]|nr:Trans-1,2-dihydrobenzene-1,2-diol dehydrogenase-like isoform X2 [Aphelenchoides fujianensis]
MSSKTDDSPLRWGILGCGNISGDFVRAMTVCQHKNEIHGLAAASSLERAEVFRNEHFGADDSCVAIQRAKCHGSYAELLERKDIDVVYVGVANHLHKPVVLQAIEAGKHVVCEKPLALNRAEVAEMFERAKAKGVRFFPVWRQLKAGAIAEVGGPNVVLVDFGINVERVKNTPREQGGGYLMASGCYAVMFAQFVFDEEKPEVIVANGQLDEKGIDLWASITLKYSGGRVANLFYHGLQETPCQASVNGPKGQLRLPEAFWSPSKLIVQSGGEEPKTHDHPLPATDLKFFFPNSVGLCYEADHVYECLKQGESSGFFVHFSCVCRQTGVADHAAGHIAPFGRNPRRDPQTAGRSVPSRLEGRQFEVRAEVLMEISDC